MTDPLSTETSPPPSLEPVYSGDSSRGAFTAEFASGVRVSVKAGRGCAYPGLPSFAPATSAFYTAFQELSGDGPILDAGAGSGIGTRALLQQDRRVVAVDCDPAAVAFGREYASGASWLTADLCTESPASDMAAAVVCDVLGHVGDPEAFLRNVRRSLVPDGRLLIAEPFAHLSQRLLAPARRAFTPAELKATLTRSGFVVEGWLCESGTFVACVARRIEDSAFEALARAGELAQRGEFEAARALLAQQKTERAPLALEILLAQAELALAARQGDAAAAAFIQARQLAPTDARALTGLARITLSFGATEDALRFALEAAHAEPTSALAAATLAMVGERLEHPDAFNAWRVAVNLAPDDVGIVTGLGRAAAARGEYHFAVCAFDRARAYGDDLGPEFHVTLGWLLLADGRRHDALVEARLAQALAPDDDSTRELLAAASVRESD